MFRIASQTRPSNNEHNCASVATLFQSNPSYQSGCPMGSHIIRVIDFVLVIWMIHKAKETWERILVYLSRISFFLRTYLFRVRSVSHENIKETLTVTLALTENSNVAQTLGAHLRRKRAAVTSSWMRDGRVNQSLVAFSRCCMPRYMRIRETRRERGFYLYVIGRKFPLLGNLLFTQDHLGEAILPHNSITVNPVSYFVKSPLLAM